MKRLFYLVALLACIVISITACDTDSSVQYTIEPEYVQRPTEQSQPPAPIDEKDTESQYEPVYNMTYQLYDDGLPFGIARPVNCEQITHTHIQSSANEAIQIGSLQITVKDDVRFINYEEYGIGIIGVTLFTVRVTNKGEVGTYLSSLEFSRLNSNSGYPVSIDYIYIGDKRTPISILPPLYPGESMYFYLPVEAFACENSAWYRPFANSERITDHANDHATAIHYVFYICLRNECTSGTCW